ncbi:MAG: HD domain-containing protein [Lachnospiraceae bacterium]|nr:HD domain-containing protein [Lachnospiraceae bacterium]
MKYIESLKDGMHIKEVYLCKSKNIALTKNGKEYGNLVLQDKTGQIEGKIWDLGSPGVRDFEAMDFVEVDALVTIFNGGNQLNVRMIGRASEGSYNSADYFPTSEKNIGQMQQQLKELIVSIKNQHLRALLGTFFGSSDFVRRFSEHSAAKSVHHGFIGGLLEHSLSVAQLCDNIAAHYGTIVNRDLLVTGAILHDVGKLKELSAFPTNEYTDAGQLLGHIMIGAQMVSNAADSIEDFPERLKNELIHMILSHHGELEFGSPKKPALVEAMILSFVDNMDAKVETMYEAFENKQPQNADGWLGFNKLLDSNIRKTGEI